MKRTPLNKGVIWVVLFLLFITCGCVQKPQETKLASISIAFQGWVGYGLFYLAQEKGFCKEEGIELVFIDEQLDSARRDAFKRGMLDCEAGTLDLLVSKAAQGTPIVAVMKIDNSFGSDAIVASENIKKLEDLKGKRVALARDDVGETFISTLFYRNGLPFNSVIIVPKLGEEVAQAFLKGEVDACVTWEPQVSRALRRPGAHILASTKEFPDIIIDTLNVRRDLLGNNPGAVKKLMRAWFRALKYYREYPAEASAIIAKYYNISPAQYKKQVEGLLWNDYEKQKIHTEYLGLLKAFDLIAEVKLANARIFHKPEASKFLNYTFLERLYEDSQ